MEYNQLIDELKKEVQVLKGRCDAQDRIIIDLQSKCETHENVLEVLQQEIVCLHQAGKTLSTMYGGENYDLMP
jgi:hypothetical protein